MALSFQCTDASYSADGDFPYLRTRLQPCLYNVIPLPQTAEELEAVPFGAYRSESIQNGLPFLKVLARFQAHWNRLPTWLMLAPRRCIKFTPDGNEIFSGQIQRDGFEVANHLAPWAPLEKTGWWSQRTESLIFSSHPEKPVLLINLHKGGRAATPDERERFSGRSRDGIPPGLEQCRFCSEWKGQCLDPNPKSNGLLVSVSCQCTNDSRCARCFLPLYRRKLNANYYNESDGQVWHVPGSICERHRCGVVLALDEGAGRGAFHKM